MKRMLLALVAALVFLSPDGRAQTLRRVYEQGPFTVTNAAVIQPYLCANNGTCPGTPSWATNNTYSCEINVVTANVMQRQDGGTPTTTVSGNGTEWTPGTYILTSLTQCANLKFIAETATNAKVWVKAFSQ